MATFRPGKPRVRVTVNANQTLAAGYHPIVWHVADFDDLGMWDGVSSLIVPTSGLWVVTSHVTLGTVASNGTPTVGITVNGTTVGSYQGSLNTLQQGFGLSEVLELVATDVVTLSAQRHSSASCTIPTPRAALAMTRIGPVRWTS